ncbi:tRNA-dihydrouridine synthase family protein [Candidatus Pacearchaeota archaeon]|nr:tRNA-dihydrouridine synthase family protein [Candidatus Pacearchaeota archaeon]
MKPRYLQIGKIKIEPILLAPMVEVTDLPYRFICREAGASLTYTEMLYIDAIIHENAKTKKLMQFTERERPIGIQITGSKVEHFKKAIPYLKDYDLVDINCGCPSTRIVGSEAGSYLLNNPEKIGEIIKILKSAGLIVTAKIRLGFKNNTVLETAKLIESAGADALTIHARLAHHGNDVPADWSWIKKVRSSISIPVIGNGDITSGKQAEAMLKIADACMIARAAIGDPDIFYRINRYLKTGEIIPFDLKRNLHYLKQYLDYCRDFSFTDLSRIKYITAKFFRNIEGSAKMRQQVMQCKTLNELAELADACLVASEQKTLSELIGR